MQKEKEALLHYGKLLVEKNLTSGTGGNLSIYLPKDKAMLITPSGIDYHAMKIEDLVLMDLEGNVLEGTCKPSSEHPMHSMVYKHREDIQALVHTHAVYSTALSVLNLGIPPVHYLVATGGGKDIRCSKYETFGTSSLAEKALEAMKDRWAVILANHGMLIGGPHIHSAFAKAEELEFCAQVYYRAKSMGGEPVLLSDQEMEKMVTLFQEYGQKKGGHHESSR